MSIIRYTQKNLSTTYGFVICPKFILPDQSFCMLLPDPAMPEILINIIPDRLIQVILKVIIRINLFPMSP